jgi:hypothetical protein
MKKRILLLVIGIVLFLGELVSATDYYVSASGSDSNPGTQISPWGHCPGMSGWSGSATLSAGDIVYFRSQDTWAYTGSSQNQFLNCQGGVTYIGDEWGSGTRAKFVGPGGGLEVYNNMVSINDDHATYETTLKGFEIDGNNATTNGCIIGWGTTKNLLGAKKRIVNCVGHDFGHDSDYKYAFGARGGANQEVSNFEILNNIAYNTQSDVLILYPTNEATTGKVSNGLLRGNNVYGGGRRGSQQGAGILMKNNVENVIVEFNYVHDTNHGIGIGDHTASHNIGHNITIRYNIIART